MAYSEIYEILNLLEEEYVEKIPEKVRKFFEEEKDDEYKPVIDVKKPLEQQNLKRETMVLLAILNLNYWCDSEEKQEILKSFAQNEELKKQEQEELKAKYNPENLFKKNDRDENNKMVEELSVVEYKEENFIQKIIRKIFKFFKRG